MTFRDDRATGSEPPGPFAGPRLREQPWRATETDGGPFERRRAGDRRAGTERSEAATGPERRRRWGRRKSDVLRGGGRDTLAGQGQALIRRFREPLIGLTLAGFAAPLINAGLVAPAERDEERADDVEPDATAATERDLDEEVGDYWAEAAEEMVRDQTIEGAALRWGIPSEMATQIYDAAERHDIEPDVAYGLVYVESTFRERAVSHVGARGLAQVMPRTARWLDPSVNTQDLFDPEVNLELGFRYLRQMIDKYDGDVFKALTAYNRGPGTVDRILKRGGNIDNGYAGKVLAG
jgi:hypothetical protein